MARIVVGVGTSHSPQLSTPGETWRLHAARDQRNPALHFRGEVYRFDELLKVREHEQIQKEISDEIWSKKYQACEAGITALGATIESASPDVLVIVGDDHKELFLDDNMPALSVFRGAELWSTPPAEDELDPSIVPARWANYGDERISFPCVPELAEHIIEALIVDGFDVAQFSQQPEGRSLGHAFIFPRQRLMNHDRPVVPIVPIFINDYFAPNQPTPGRCYQFGKALRRAIDSWKSDARVGVVASGGLSHFVVDEQLDRRVLSGLASGDHADLQKIPMNELNSGTSEIRNWIAVGAALDDFKMELIGYVPAYRSLAGTGCGMAFARWAP